MEMFIDRLTYVFDVWHTFYALFIDYIVIVIIYVCGFSLLYIETKDVSSLLKINEKFIYQRCLFTEFFFSQDVWVCLRIALIGPVDTHLFIFYCLTAVMFVRQ